MSAKLTRKEIETLRSDFDDLRISTIWMNARKRAPIYESTHTVLAEPAIAAVESLRMTFYIGDMSPLHASKSLRQPASIWH